MVDFKKKMSLCRITPEAHEALVGLAKERNCPQNLFLSRIILHYNRNKVDIDAHYPRIWKDMSRELSLIRSDMIMTVRAVGRTESFIKSLLRTDDKSSHVDRYLSNVEAEEAENVSAEVKSSTQLTQTLSIIGRMLDAATPATDFDCSPVMEIRIKQSEFNQLKLEYGELCTSQNT